jgi:hypothetical protein
MEPTPSNNDRAAERRELPRAGAGPLSREVEGRFGVLPDFFRLAPEAPQITANLWGFAKFG